VLLCVVGRCRIVEVGVAFEIEIEIEVEIVVRSLELRGIVERPKIGFKYFFQGQSIA
jgi:hypothetical protein